MMVVPSDRSSHSFFKPLLFSHKMSTRKRDSFGRFTSTGGTDLQRFGQESNAYKKPRNMNVQPNMPSYPGAVGDMRVPGQAPPSAAALGASYSSGVIDLASNSTSSVAVQAKPWSPVNNIPPMSPGAILFAQRDAKLASNGDSRQIRSIADLPTMNWLLKHARDNLANLADETTRLNAGSYFGAGGVLSKHGWNYIGSLRNQYKQGSSGIISLLNVDVFGRTKIACIFGKVSTGDRVGIALVPVNLTRFKSILGPGSKSTVPADYVSSLNDDATADSITNGLRTSTQTATRERFSDTGSYTVWQWLPTINGVICKFLWDLFPETDREAVERGTRLSGAPTVDFVEYVPLGCVSNAQMSRRTHDRMCRAAVFDTNRYTTCPQIEILIE